MSQGHIAVCLKLVATDLRIEARAREVLLVIAPFGALALLLAPAAVGTDQPLLERIGPGMYWLVVVLYGALVSTRRTTRSDAPGETLLRMIGVPPVTRALGHALSAGLLLVAFGAVLAPIALVVYNVPAAGLGWFALALPLVAAGLAALGTLAAGLSSGPAGGSVLGQLLVVPFALPLLLSAVQLPEAARYGRSPLPWVGLALAVDLLAILALTSVAMSLEEFQ